MQRPVAIFFGSRDWDDYEAIFWRMALLPRDTIIRHGAARGADSIAGMVARALGFEEDPHPVPPEEWRRRGLRAGHDRNRKMALLGADIAIGFRCPGKSNGTDGMREQAELCNIPVEMHGTDWKEYDVSSTNRGESSSEDWETPLWCVRRLLEEVWLPPGEWLEPAAGNGRIIRAVNEDRPGAMRWTAVELRSACAVELKKQEGLVHVACPTDFIKDFSPFNRQGKKLAVANARQSFFDVAILNPPFSKSMEILSKCLAVAEYVAMLQRMNWLGSGTNNGKNDFLRGCAPDVFPLPNRVKFLLNGKFPRHPEGTKDGKGNNIGGHLMSGDSIEYAWYVWGPKETRMRERGDFRMLAETSTEERTTLEEAA